MNNNEDRINTERSFISILLQHKDLVGDWISSNLKPFHFRKDHKPILLAIEKSFQKGELLTKEAFFNFARQISTDEASLNAQIFLFDRLTILDISRDNFSLLKDEIMEFYVSEHSIEYIESFRKDKNKLGSVQAARDLSKKMNNLVQDSREKAVVSYESVSSYAPKFLSMMEEKRLGNKELENITCGIADIDYTMVVGFAPGSLTLFCADVSNYKTTMMLNIANNVWNNGKYSTLLVPLEMPREKMYQKLMALRTGVPFDRIEKPKLLTKKEIELIKNQTKFLEGQRGNTFYILDTYERIPVSFIYREIEKHIDVFKPILVVVDYIGTLIAEESDKSKRDDIQIGNMLKDLRIMGRPGALHENGFAVVSGAQIGRDALKRIRKMGSKKVSFYSEDIRSSHEYSADADNIYVQMIDERQPDSRLKLFVIKTRYGKKAFKDRSLQAILEIKPEIGLIRSAEDSWVESNSEEIMKNVNDPNINIDDQLIFDSKAEELPVNDPDVILGCTGANIINDDNLSIEDIDIKDHD